MGSGLRKEVNSVSLFRGSLFVWYVADMESIFVMRWGFCKDLNYFLLLILLAWILPCWYCFYVIQTGEDICSMNCKAELPTLRNLNLAEVFSAYVRVCSISYSLFNFNLYSGQKSKKHIWYLILGHLFVPFQVATSDQHSLVCLETSNHALEMAEFGMNADLLPEFKDDTWDFNRHRWSKKGSSLCAYEWYVLSSYFVA